MALALLAAGAAAPAAAQLQLPKPVGYVNDFANVIPPEQEARITRLIEEVRAKSGGEIAVVTLPSLQGQPVDEVGLQILRQWGVGAKTQIGDSLNNTGAVILVAPKERQTRVELGYTTNTFVTAAEAGRIRDEMSPYFRKGDFGGGLLLGTATLAQKYAQHFGFKLTGDVPTEPQAAPQSGGRGPGFL
ncbi:MAG TPA: TPM domain-containing protein, partial [Longimicrobiaceae bacterium]|nr:TPM domain-containing protein [Longimicrobiaceae bacterium]